MNNPNSNPKNLTPRQMEILAYWQQYDQKYPRAEGRLVSWTTNIEDENAGIDALDVYALVDAGFARIRPDNHSGWGDDQFYITEEGKNWTPSPKSETSGHLPGDPIIVTHHLWKDWNGEFVSRHPLYPDSSYVRISRPGTGGHTKLQALKNSQFEFILPPHPDQEEEPDRLFTTPEIRKEVARKAIKSFQKGNPVPGIRITHNRGTGLNLARYTVLIEDYFLLFQVSEKGRIMFETEYSNPAMPFPEGYFSVPFEEPIPYSPEHLSYRQIRRIAEQENYYVRYMGREAFQFLRGTPLFEISTNGGKSWNVLPGTLDGLINSLGQYPELFFLIHRIRTILREGLNLKLGLYLYREYRENEPGSAGAAEGDVSEEVSPLFEAERVPSSEIVSRSSDEASSEDLEVPLPIAESGLDYHVTEFSELEPENRKKIARKFLSWFQLTPEKAPNVRYFEGAGVLLPRYEVRIGGITLLFTVDKYSRIKFGREFNSNPLFNPGTPVELLQGRDRGIAEYDRASSHQIGWSYVRFNPGTPAARLLPVRNEWMIKIEGIEPPWKHFPDGSRVRLNWDGEPKTGTVARKLPRSEPLYVVILDGNQGKSYFHPEKMERIEE